MSSFNHKVLFPGKLINFSQMFMNYYYKKKMLTFVIFASLGGLRKVQKQLKSFPVNLKSEEKKKKKREGEGEEDISCIAHSRDSIKEF